MQDSLSKSAEHTTARSAKRPAKRSVQRFAHELRSRSIAGRRPAISSCQIEALVVWPSLLAVLLRLGAARSAVASPLTAPDEETWTTRRGGHVTGQSPAFAEPSGVSEATTNCSQRGALCSEGSVAVGSLDLGVDTMGISPYPAPDGHAD